MKKNAFNRHDRYFIWLVAMQNNRSQYLYLICCVNYFCHSFATTFSLESTTFFMWRWKFADGPGIKISRPLLPWR